MRARSFIIVPAVLAVLAVVGLTALVGWRHFCEAPAGDGNYAIGPETIPAPAPPPAGPHPSRITLTIGPETTHVSGPVGSDGYVDYQAALNERFGKGVTPKTNANVLLWKALGPTPDGSKRMPARFFELLGTEEPPEKGEYFVRLKEFARKRFKMDDAEATRLFDEDLRRLARTPWSPKDHAHIAAWLTANRKPLALVVEASKRPNFFSPIVSFSILVAMDPTLMTGRELAYALASRAMLEVNDGKPVDAWQDLLACHRLARLLGRGSTFLDYQVGIGLDQVGGAADVAFLERARLSAKQIRDCARDLRALPPMPALADSFDVGERFEVLDEMRLFAKHGFWYLEQLADGDLGSLRDEPVPNINWDPGLRAVNQWFDGVVAAMRESDRPVRQERLGRIESDFKEMKTRIATGGDYYRARGNMGLSPEAKGRVCGDLLLGLVAPAVDKLQRAADRYEQGERNLHIAFALAAYRADHVGYPKSLTDLTPKYLDKLLDDLFTGKPLIYKPEDNGFLLYSLGPNGKDDGGQGLADDPKGDDIAIRLPVPAK